MHLDARRPPPPSASLPLFASFPAGAPQGPSPFSLSAQKDDTAMLRDERICFSHLLPGRPALGLPPRAGEPAADVVVHLQDAPITLRYLLAPPPVPVASAADAVRAAGDRHAGWRANAPIRTELANPTWLRAWGVDAAAVAVYDVGDGRHREDLFALAKDGLVLTITWTHPRGFVNDPAYAAFASIAEATMSWDRARWGDLRSRRVWPESVFGGPGLFGRPIAKHDGAARAVAQTTLAPEERARLLATLSRIVSDVGAPWVSLSRETIDASFHALTAATENATVHAFLRGAARDVTTAHDLRGLAVMLGRALSGRVPSLLDAAAPASA